jgi:hypothetical protein
MDTRWLWTLAVLGLGCGVAPAKDGPQDPSEAGSSSGDPGSSSGEVLDPEPETSSSEGGEESSSTGCGFICPDDPEFECDPWAQDCPTGEKCAPWVNNGGDSWNALRCVPVDVNSGEPGDGCTAEGLGASGFDTCALGAMCWNVDEAGAGVCVAFCDGSPDNASCSDVSTTCVIANDGVLNLCLPVCDPLLQDCGGNQACYPVGDSFACGPDVSGEMGLFGEPCAAINVCDAGLWCAAAAAVPGCAGAEACCTSFCDLDEGAACPGVGQECVAWFDVGEAPPGAEALGACVIPE